MASPFRVFRKHQKKLLATLGIMAVVAFCIPMGFIDYIRTRSAPPSAVVKTSKYGNIEERELERLRYDRQTVLNFLQRVQQAVVTVKQQANLQADADNPVRVSADMAQQVEGMLGPATEEAVVENWLLVKQAEELGLTVSDKAINDFIREVTEDLLKPDQVKKIITDIRSNQPRFFALLRQELLALRVRMMFSLSLAGTTPAQRWEYYTRLKRMATIELIPVPVADYVEQVADPPVKVLQRFFEKHKDEYPDPTSPEPGFRKPHQIAVRFFKADVEKFLGHDVITEDEVKAFYEENKEYCDQLVPILTGTAAEEAKDPSAEEAEKDTAAEENGGAEEEKPPAEEPTTEKKEETGPEGESPGQPAAEAPQGEESAGKPATEDNTEGGAAEQPTEQVPAKDTNKPDEPAIDPSNPGGTSSAGVASPFKLTSLLREEPGEQDAVPAETPTEESSEPASESDAEPATSPAESGGPALGPEPLPGDALPAEEPAKGAEEPAEGVAEPTAEVPEKRPEKAGPSSEPTVDPPEKGPEVEKKEPEDPLAGPLGEWIRRQLAIRKIEEIFGRLQGRMNRYRNDWVRYEVDRVKDRDAVTPEEPDFEALAKEYDPTGAEGLTTDATPLMSQWDVQTEESGLGRSFVTAGTTRIPLVEYAFRERWDLYVAAQSSDIGEDYRERSRYLFWKVEDSKQKVQEFEDPGVREQVLLEWKMSEARKLAKKAAETLAGECRKSGQSFEITFVERPELGVVSTRPFSWMTYGNVPLGTARTPARLSQVEGVDMAGPEFMRAVFQLKQGQVGVAMNHPETIAYVVRASEINPPRSTLWAQFQVDNFATYADVASADRGQMFQAWQDELRETAGLEWVRPPSRGRSE